MNIGDLEDMNKVKEWLRTWWILFLFVAITIIGYLFLYVDGDTDTVSEILKALDTSSAIALAFLAFYAYFEYAKEKHDFRKFSKQLESISNLKNRHALVGIQFGGGNANAIAEMKSFAVSKNIDSNLIITKRFGDENNQVSEVDIDRLEKYLKQEVMHMLAGADTIHLTVSGASVALFVCGDVFANWKPIVVYHRNKSGEYKEWYCDSKHRDKIESTLKDNV